MAFDMSKAAFGKASASNLDKVQRIPLGFIKSNEQNFYSIEGIDELADSIAMVGLLEPVRVVRIPSSPTQPYRYKLISGHRRFWAFMRLCDRKEEGYLQYEEIPALVMEDMDDLTETFALITANSTARELTYAEKLKQEQLLRETLTAMKEAGKPVPKNLGQYIADQLQDAQHQREPDPGGPGAGGQGRNDRPEGLRAQPEAGAGTAGDGGGPEATARRDRPGGA